MFVGKKGRSQDAHTERKGVYIYIYISQSPTYKQAPEYHTSYIIYLSYIPIYTYLPTLHISLPTTPHTTPHHLHITSHHPHTPWGRKEKKIRHQKQQGSEIHPYLLFLYTYLGTYLTLVLYRRKERKKDYS
ncbi:hypothetical protein F5X96DRAFT_651285 [Biscogniauxia mediterranea]|nr:hypothetical protein F5X96DRAFT_651285 [Biscogniauxia mediterranea]